MVMTRKRIMMKHLHYHITMIIFYMKICKISILSFFFKWPTDLWVAVRLSFWSWIIHNLWWVMLWSLPFSHSRSSVIIKAQCEVHKFIQCGYNFSSIHVCAWVWSENEKEWEWWRKWEGEWVRERAVEWNWTPEIDLVPASFITLYGPVLSHWVGHTNKPLLISRKPPTSCPSRVKGIL